ncbi:hypothetical protein BH10CHL1_BH10CHL1_36040 [soil metagenome]
MTEQPHNPDGNPLDDFADEFSGGWKGAPVEMNESATTRVEGGQVWMKQSAARSVQASALHLEESAAGVIQAGVVDARKSNIGVVIAREVKLERVNTPLLVAATVEAKELQTIALIAGRVQGNVKTVFTPLTALAAGAGFALTLLAFKNLVANIVRLSAQRQAKKHK